MTIARVNSFAFAGIDAQPVEVQVQIASGLPNFLMVGLPDKAVGEAREGCVPLSPPWAWLCRQNGCW